MQTGQGKASSRAVLSGRQTEILTQKVVPNEESQCPFLYCSSKGRMLERSQGRQSLSRETGNITAGHLLLCVCALCLPSVYPLSTLCLPSVHPLSTLCLPSVCPLSTLCLPSVYPLSTLCLPSVYPLSTLCLPSVYPLST